MLEASPALLLFFLLRLTFTQPQIGHKAPSHTPTAAVHWAPRKDTGEGKGRSKAVPAKAASRPLAYRRSA